MNDDEGLVSFDDAYALGMKLVEMMDRVRAVDKVVPGTQAVQCATMEDVRYRIVVTVEHA